MIVVIDTNVLISAAIIKHSIPDLANADCIITGDQDLLVLHPFENIPIISPKEFLNRF